METEQEKLSATLLVARRDQLMSELDLINAEIQNRFQADALKVFDDADKTHGQVNFVAQGVELAGTVRKNVTWDTKLLRSAADKLTGVQFDGLFTMKLTIPETKYNAIMDEELRAAVDAARTVRFSEMKVTVPKDD